eukprot:CAMPEP_0174340968 /NCGR_PEP_ID=MMETSP0810-20121108/25030_1 /TAXON_ID=73025 ORGANISM="Eutreptiella gymnastica-like, Strain CCMP1594" /NCGR_SAMPLE_ID=MMETSP0810 /ASSEMBLY_ACC=CAM_ASM_000659 /LENGTH=186 /DNA_ID=CAMNT_0015462311 /DNA_START=145 /DNA_END=705 /DNA_ORIENTATION=+
MLFCYPKNGLEVFDFVPELVHAHCEPFMGVLTLRTAEDFTNNWKQHVVVLVLASAFLTYQEEWLIGVLGHKHVLSLALSASQLCGLVGKVVPLQGSLQFGKPSAGDALDDVSLLLSQSVHDDFKNFLDQVHTRLKVELSGLEVDLRELSGVSPGVFNIHLLADIWRNPEDLLNVTQSRDKHFVEDH